MSTNIDDEFNAMLKGLGEIQSEFWVIAHWIDGRWKHGNTLYASQDECEGWRRYYNGTGAAPSRVLRVHCEFDLVDHPTPDNEGGQS